MMRILRTPLPTHVVSLTPIADPGGTRRRYVGRTVLARAVGVLLAGGAALACMPAGDAEDGRPAGSQATLFTDVTAQSGLDFVHGPPFDGSYYVGEQLGSGAALFDYDGDDDLDVYVVNTARRSAVADSLPLRNRLWQQVDGTFVDVTDESGLGDTGYGVGVAVGDIDNNGHPDVYITNIGLDALYQNEGDGTFRNVTEGAGIDNREWGASATFFDFDL
ncbi:MAG: VCBS repeat-containing protein, partial [Gemmatimonadota bacterium]